MDFQEGSPGYFRMRGGGGGSEWGWCNSYLLFVQYSTQILFCKMLAYLTSYFASQPYIQHCHILCASACERKCLGASCYRLSSVW